MTDLNWGWWVAPMVVTVLCCYWFHFCTGRYIRDNSVAAARELAVAEAGGLGGLAAIAWIVWAVLA